MLSCAQMLDVPWLCSLFGADCREYWSAYVRWQGGNSDFLCRGHLWEFRDQLEHVWMGHEAIAQYQRRVAQVERRCSS